MLTPTRVEWGVLAVSYRTRRRRVTATSTDPPMTSRSAASATSLELRPVSGSSDSTRADSIARVSAQVACLHESDARVTESFVSGLAAVNSTDADAVPAWPNEALNSFSFVPSTPSDAQVHVIERIFTVQPLGTDLGWRGAGMSAGPGHQVLGRDGTTTRVIFRDFV